MGKPPPQVYICKSTNPMVEFIEVLREMSEHYGVDVVELCVGDGGVSRLCVYRRMRFGTTSTLLLVATLTIHVTSARSGITRTSPSRLWSSWRRCAVHFVLSELLIRQFTWKVGNAAMISQLPTGGSVGWSPYDSIPIKGSTSQSNRTPARCSRRNLALLSSPLLQGCVGPVSNRTGWATRASLVAKSRIT